MEAVRLDQAFRQIAACTTIDHSISLKYETMSTSRLQLDALSIQFFFSPETMSREALFE